MRLPRRDGLNIVPFIDIMLVLLAIVLSVATFISQGHIKIKVPESNSAEAIKDEQKLSILLTKDDKFYIDERESALNEVKSRIAEIESSVLVELVSDKEAKFQSFIDILDILKERGHEKFVIKAESK